MESSEHFRCRDFGPCKYCNKKDFRSDVVDKSIVAGFLWRTDEKRRKRWVSCLLRPNKKPQKDRPDCRRRRAIGFSRPFSPRFSFSHSFSLFATVHRSKAHREQKNGRKWATGGLGHGLVSLHRIPGTLSKRCAQGGRRGREKGEREFAQSEGREGEGWGGGGRARNNA